MTYKVTKHTTEYRSDRTATPIYLAVHRTQGSWQSAVNWFEQPGRGSSGTSADEVISRDGSQVAVFNTPATRLKTWSVGNANSLVACNFEVEGFVGDEDTLPDSLFDTLADRIDNAADAAFKEYDSKIPLRVTGAQGHPGIVGHHTLAVWYGGSDHTCPGNFPWPRLEDAIADLRKPDVPEPVDYVILGAGLPAKIVRYRKAGDGRTSEFLNSIEPETLNRAADDRLVIVKQTRRRPPKIGARL